MTPRRNELYGQDILVIDDDVALLQLIECALGQVGCNVYTATEGWAGLDYSISTNLI